LALYTISTKEYERVVSSSPPELAAVHTRKTEGFSKKHFDLRLQTIRGLAALVVAFHHSFNMFPFPTGPAKVLRGVESVVSPQAAVITFFILSGYVLGLALGKTPKLTAGSYLQFMVKRVCRIMVPLWIIILAISVVVTGFLWVMTGNTYISPENWKQPSLMGSTYGHPFDLNVLVRNLLLLDHDLDSVTWTITIEMVGSALIPFFFFINRFSFCRGALLLALMAISLAISTDGSSFWHYLYMFELGLLIPFWGPIVFAFLQRRGLLLLSLIIALFICMINGHFGHNFYILGPALSFILGFVIFRDHPWLKLLDDRIAIWLGKVSYSFYLIHWPVLWLIACLFTLGVPRFGNSHSILLSFLSFLVSVPLAALIADASYNWIETPAINLGKRLIGKPLRLTPHE
jgi:peptidoglycan/LPS O-acetylase OafA/YrhL